MRTTRYLALQTSKRILRGPYDPTIEDARRIVKTFRVEGEYGTLAATIKDVYSWLAQEPVCVNLMGGDLCARFEIRDNGKGDICCAHYCYINDKEDVMCEGFLYDDEGLEIVNWKLSEYVKLVAGTKVSEEVSELKSMDELPF